MMSDEREPWPIPRADSASGPLLCFGGSFDPIHLGHLLTARAAAESLGLPGVRLIPTSASPHKTANVGASAAERFELCTLAVAGDPFFTVDPIEVSRPPPGYTFDTVVALSVRSGDRLRWLIGADLLPRLHTWHRFDELREACEFVVMGRAGHAIILAALDPRVREIASRIVTVPQVEISSTFIRERLRRGESIRYWVPDAVANRLQLQNASRRTSR